MIISDALQEWGVRPSGRADQAQLYLDNGRVVATIDFTRRIAEVSVAAYDAKAGTVERAIEFMAERGLYPVTTDGSDPSGVELMMVGGEEHVIHYFAPRGLVEECAWL